MNPIPRILACVVLVPIVVLAAACATNSHDVAPQGAASSLGCQLCYDEVVRVRKAGFKNVLGRTVIVRRHQCPECRGDVDISSEDGTGVIHCTSCAPNGLECDRCQPPAATK